MRRSIAGSKLILAAALVLTGCGPMITNPARLPEQVRVCGWDWRHDADSPARTRSEVAEQIRADPPILDLGSMLCPKGACTNADVESGSLKRGACQPRIWVRVGWDSYAQYGMLFRL